MKKSLNERQLILLSYLKNQKSFKHLEDICADLREQYPLSKKNVKSFNNEPCRRILTTDIQVLKRISDEVIISNTRGVKILQNKNELNAFIDYLDIEETSHKKALKTIYMIKKKIRNRNQMQFESVN